MNQLPSTEETCRKTFTEISQDQYTANKFTHSEINCYLSSLRTIGGLRRPALLDPAANSADYDVIEVDQLGQLAQIEHILVELVIVHHGEYHRIQSLQLTHVVFGDVTQIYLETFALFHYSLEKK